MMISFDLPIFLDVRIFYFGYCEMIGLPFALLSVQISPVKNKCIFDPGVTWWNYDIIHENSVPISI